MGSLEGQLVAGCGLFDHGILLEVFPEELVKDSTPQRPCDHGILIYRQSLRVEGTRRVFYAFIAFIVLQEVFELVSFRRECFDSLSYTIPSVFKDINLRGASLLHFVARKLSGGHQTVGQVEPARHLRIMVEISTGSGLGQIDSRRKPRGARTRGPME